MLVSKCGFKLKNSYTSFGFAVFEPHSLHNFKNLIAKFTRFALHIRIIHFSIIKQPKLLVICENRKYIVAILENFAISLIHIFSNRFQYSKWIFLANSKNLNLKICRVRTAHAYLIRFSPQSICLFNSRYFIINICGNFKSLDQKSMLRHSRVHFVVRS